MKLNFTSTPSFYQKNTQETQVHTSNASERSSVFSTKNEISTIEQKSLVDNYFKIFDKSYSELTIKNLIAARLQPTASLPTVHNTQELSLKVKELLDFSLSI